MMVYQIEDNGDFETEKVYARNEAATEEVIRRIKQEMTDYPNERYGDIEIRTERGFWYVREPYLHTLDDYYAADRSKKGIFNVFEIVLKYWEMGRELYWYIYELEVVE